MPTIQKKLSISRRSELCNGRKFENASCKKYQI
jgi:hypothetical protein